MAKDDERPQFNPKHRIAGAIILVSLAVIFVPMLLDESAPPDPTRALTQIPDSPALDTKVVVMPVTPETRTVATAPSANTAPSKPASDEIANTESKPVNVAAVEKKPETAKAKPVTAKPSDVTDKIAKGWIVQVGTFANVDNAERLRDKLKGSGYAVKAESITVQGSKAMRLRIGPYRDKTAATKVQAQLQKDLNIQGMLLAYP